VQREPLTVMILRNAGIGTCCGIPRMTITFGSMTRSDKCAGAATGGALANRGGRRGRTVMVMKAEGLRSELDFGRREGRWESAIHAVRFYIK
jgi:hypothetical protein